MKYGRLTAQQANELGYIPAKIKLNGIYQENVLVIDDIEGWIEVIDTDQDGGWLIENDELKTKKLFGQVEYFPREPS